VVRGPVNKVVDPKRIIGKNGGLRRRRGTRGCCSPRQHIVSKFESSDIIIYNCYMY
jgi:hypothetical protein